jgi:hypothetical protein
LHLACSHKSNEDIESPWFRQVVILSETETAWHDGQLMVGGGPSDKGGTDCPRTFFLLQILSAILDQSPPVEQTPHAAVVCFAATDADDDACSIHRRSELENLTVKTSGTEVGLKLLLQSQLRQTILLLETTLEICPFDISSVAYW